MKTKLQLLTIVGCLVTYFNVYSQTDSFWFEAECATSVGSDWDVIDDVEASNGQYITLKESVAEVTSPPPNTTGETTFTFYVTTAGDYSVWLRINAPSAQDDSFLAKMDDGSWSTWNQLDQTSGWYWAHPGTNSYNLTAGHHTFTIAPRENGALLDKIYIGADTPSGMGSEGCATASITDNISSLTGLKVAPNPSNGVFKVKFNLLNSEKVDIKLITPLGQVVKTLVDKELFPGENELSVTTEDLPSNVYFIVATSSNKKVQVKRIIIN